MKKLIFLCLAMFLGLVSCAFGQEVNDEDIRVGDFEEMRYPLAARLNHVQGAVVVRAKLDKEGNVAEAEAISGAKLLIPDCVANAKKWSFSTSKGQKMAVIVYRFTIEGLCHGTVSSQFIYYPPNIAIVRSCEEVVE